MPSNNFYSNASYRGEVDMRNELIHFLQGSFPEIAKKQKALLRKMRRDSDGDLVKCACVDSNTGEPDKDVLCPLCFGEGYYWSEEWMDVYKIIIRSDVGNAWREELLPPTIQDTPVAVFFTSYSHDITEEDKVITLKANNDGTVYKPYIRRDVYRIGSLIDMRSDSGRLEFWKVACYKENVKFLNGPDG